MLQSFKEEGESLTLGFLCRREGQDSAARKADQPGGQAALQNTQLSPGEGGQAQQHATEPMEASARCWDAVIYVFFLSSFSQNTPCLLLCQPLAMGMHYSLTQHPEEPCPGKRPSLLYLTVHRAAFPVTNDIEC